jgi:hypothetical protein
MSSASKGAQPLNGNYGNTESGSVNNEPSYNIKTTDSPTPTKRNPKDTSTYPSGLGTGP